MQCDPRRRLAVTKSEWHSDGEPLFGASGKFQLIVSLSFGVSALSFDGNLVGLVRICLEDGLLLSHGDLLLHEWFSTG